MGGRPEERFSVPTGNSRSATAVCLFMLTVHVYLDL